MSAVVGPGGRILAWRDGIPLRYEYTAGAAGEVFLRGLFEGRILASKCSRCGETRLPPRSYCLECYARARVDVEVQHQGRLASLTVAGRGRSAKALAFVTFEGVKGGLIHRALREGGSDPSLGAAMRPVFRPPGERRGAILDLRGFVAAARGRRANR